MRADIHTKLPCCPWPQTPSTNRTHKSSHFLFSFQWYVC